MAKDDNVISHVPKERHEWKCKFKGCGAKGKAATKKDAQLALALHVALTHDDWK